MQAVKFAAQQAQIDHFITEQLSLAITRWLVSVVLYFQVDNGNV
jgi:hypothetical protein